MDQTISVRRLAGFAVLTVAIVVGTLAFAFAVSSPSSGAPPQQEATTSAAPSPAEIVVPAGTIPPFVPVPSGPFP